MANNNNQYLQVGQLAINKQLYQMINDEVVPGTDVEPSTFWSALQSIVAEFEPKNQELLVKRDALQKQIDQWHTERATQAHDPEAYKTFLQEIGYLLTEPENCQVTTAQVDEEIASIAGPQLVVPLDNARYALNAANARWCSLYDALYGSDIIAQSDGCAIGKKYNPVRGDRVVTFVRDFLDAHFPLEKNSHNHAVLYQIDNGLVKVTFGDGSNSSLLFPEQFIGYNGQTDKPDSLLLKNHDLHVDILFGEGYFIGRRDLAGIYDVHMESAITTIMDCEDSVSSVDAEDKLRVYRNWLGLMTAKLTETVEKNGKLIERKLIADRHYLDAQGQAITMHGRSLMLVRNVGSQLLTDAILYDGQPIAETLLDIMVTVLSAKHDLVDENKTIKNSRTNSVYIVKPKMHGPEEVALANQLFDRVEDALGLNRHSLKMGIMDEERRTSVNLKACIQAAEQRVFFINTGFLDRTGDDIHTNMEAGLMPPKDTLKQAAWLSAYEQSNVQTGLSCGLQGRAQIGKGMWAMPDEMAAMLDTKIQHLIAGANTSWVPSPTAATIHAIHYHRFDVTSRQKLMATPAKNLVDTILEIPHLDHGLSQLEIQSELENNAQGILGYVARWVGQGIGCSKVFDINDIALMEDCATLRISSQLLANWLHHGVISEKQIRQVFEHMAVVVDRQNQKDSHYQPMAENFEQSPSFQAAIDLVFKGREQPNGYTEHILYQRRKQAKREQIL